jgi:hypothetical protein
MKLPAAELRGILLIKINKSSYHLLDNRFNKWHLQGDFLRLRSEQVNAPKAHKPLLSRLKSWTFDTLRLKMSWTPVPPDSNKKRPPIFLTVLYSS